MPYSICRSAGVVTMAVLGQEGAGYVEGNGGMYPGKGGGTLDGFLHHLDADLNVRKDQQVIVCGCFIRDVMIQGAKFGSVDDVRRSLAVGLDAEQPAYSPPQAGQAIKI